MALTDKNILSEIQLHLLEPDDAGVSIPSGLWTITEIINYCNQRQNRFLKETALLLSQLPIVVTSGQTQITLPDVWIATQRVSWKDNVTGLGNSVAKGSVLESDLAQPGWETTVGTRPLTFSDADAPATLLAYLMPGPPNAGVLTLLCIGLAGALDGTGEIWTVPYEFVPSIKYGVLADMLIKAGRAHDADRAVYCEMRYQEGIEAAKVMMESWS
jgi:hypothetical protein